MIYNVALVFDEEVNRDILGFYEKFLSDLDFEFGLKAKSICHATVVKFESDDELSKEELRALLCELGGGLKVDFSGIAFLPSHSNKGCWVEISILKSRELIEIQDELVKRLNGYDVKSGVGDRFRPHITFGKMRDCGVVVEALDYSVLRKRGVSVRLVVGTADEDFEFYEL